ncbi:MAG: four-helix bundle copper-binding protein [Rhodospirillales bacterium]|nr:four-helix bundle copper-binding protein [Rhodospirillales bacterium]
MSEEDCIRACTDSHNVCLECLAYCMEQGGQYAEEERLQILVDCADICHLSADFMLRGSPRHRLTCGICERICKDCASCCEAMPEDGMMRRCARVCRTCAAYCGEMAAAA